MIFNDKILQTQKNVTKEEQKELIFNDLIKNDSMKYNFELFKSDWEPLQLTSLLPAGSRSGENHPMRGTFSLLTDEIFIPDNLIAQINPQIKIYSQDGKFYEKLTGKIHVWDIRRYTRIYNDEDKSIIDLIYKGYGTNPLYPDISAGTINAISVIDTSEANTEVTYPGNWWVTGENVEDYQYYSQLFGNSITETIPSSTNTDENGVITVITGPFVISWSMSNITNIDSITVTGIASYINRTITTVEITGNKVFVGSPIPHYEITPPIDNFITINPELGSVISILVWYYPDNSLFPNEEYASYDVQTNEIIFNYDLGVPGYIEVIYHKNESQIGSLTVQHTNIDTLKTYTSDSGGQPVELDYSNPPSFLFEGAHSLSPYVRIFQDEDTLIPLIEPSYYTYNHPNDELLYLSEIDYPEGIDGYNYNLNEQKHSLIKTRTDYYKIYIEGSVLFLAKSKTLIEDSDSGEYTESIFPIPEPTIEIPEPEMTVSVPIILNTYIPNNQDILVQCTVNLMGKPIQNISYGSK